ncbi:MAG: HDIG domain-containing protein [Paludibacteraceae bacterium]|nr:HDIG domain-containing protein [Paludibacteraceae bacterium]
MKSTSPLNTPPISLFVRTVSVLLMIIVIALLYPHKDLSLRQKAEIGRPWSYGLVTAPYDFPIYKSEAQLTAEKADVKHSFTPYFQLHPSVAKTQQDTIQHEAQQTLTAQEQSYLIAAVKQIYSHGVMSVDDRTYLQQEGYTRLRLIDERRVASEYDISGFYTPKSAYDELLSKSPEGEMSLLNRLSLNRMLLPNISLDTALTNRQLQAELAAIPIYSGVVQEGEKIIDKGEIVTDETWQILTSLRQTEEERGLNKGQVMWSMTGLVLLILVFVMLMIFYLRVFRPKLFEDTRSWLFFTILITSIVSLACLVERFTLLSIYIVPFAWVPVITRVFYDSRTALYMHLVTIFVCAMLAPVPYEFLILQMAVGMVAVSSLRDMAQRSQLVQTALWIFLTYCVCYTAVILTEKGNPDTLHWHTYVYFLTNALLVVFAYGLIYLFERVFGLVSSITLVELTNVNSDFMLTFAEKAPGTFQHCLQVSNLAMEAAKEVQANALLVRTGALYHDIGKIEAPQFFTENQTLGDNPLLRMPSTTAAQTVIRHIEDGVELAKKNHLPEVIIDFILTHHGTSKVRFFYNTWCNEHPGETPDEALFTYPGPTPSTKETAILMMADAVEARSRSLTDLTEESIAEMVNDMIDRQLSEHQFDQAPLTFRDISKIKAVFTRKLISMNHHRIKYPDLK